VARDLFPIMQHGIAVEATFCRARDVFSWSQINTSRKTLCEQVIVRKSARANNGMLAADDPALDMMEPETNLEMKRAAEERQLHSIVKVHDIVEMWQGC